MKLKIYLLLIINLTIASNHIFSQEPSWEWVVSNATAKSINTDKWGNIYAVGTYHGTYFVFGKDTLYNSSSNINSLDIYILKYNSEGKILWVQTAKGSGDETAYSVATDDAGNVYVAGYFNSPIMVIGRDTIRKLDPNGCDLFLIKYNPDGKVLWARSAGGGHCYANTRSITIDKDANIYMCGFFQSNTVKFDTITLYNCIQTPECSLSQYNDLFIAKFDSSGKVVWAKSAGGNSYDYAWSILYDKSGYLYMCGFFNSSTLVFDTITLYRKGGISNPFVVKYDTDGNAIWAKRTGSEKNENYGLNLNTDKYSNVYVVGTFYGDTLTFASDTLYNSGNCNFFILKYDRAGNELWARTAKESNNSSTKSVEIDTSNNVYVAGIFTGKPFKIDSTDIVNKSTDIFFIKYNENGKIIWYKIIAGEKNDAVLCMVIDDFNNLYMTGNATAGAKFDTIEITKTIGYLAKLSLNIIDNENKLSSNNNINLYPNPNDGSFFVDLSATGKIIAEVYNILGEKIHAEHLYISKGNTTLKLKIPNPHHGIYFVKLVTQHDVYTKKVNIQ